MVRFSRSHEDSDASRRWVASRHRPRTTSVQRRRQQSETDDDDFDCSWPTAQRHGDQASNYDCRRRYQAYHCTQGISTQLPIITIMYTQGQPTRNKNQLQQWNTATAIRQRQTDVRLQNVIIIMRGLNSKQVRNDSFSTTAWLLLSIQVNCANRHHLLTHFIRRDSLFWRQLPSSSTLINCYFKLI